MSFPTEHEWIQILRERLRALPSARAQAPESLVLGVREQLQADAARSSRRARLALPPPRAWRFRWLIPAATLVAGVFLGLFLAPHPRRAVPGQEVPVTVQNYLDDVTHDGYLFAQLAHPLELACSDANQASSWLGAGLPFHPSLSGPPAGWQLQGVRIWHTVSRLSALAQFTDGRGAQVLLFAVPAAEIEFNPADAEPTDQGPVYLGQGWGNQALAWRNQDLAWSVVSTLPRARLLAWLKAYRAAS